MVYLLIALWIMMLVAACAPKLRIWRQHRSDIKITRSDFEWQFHLEEPSKEEL